MSKTSFVVGEHQYLAKMAASILNAKDRNLEETFFALETVCLKHTGWGSGIGFVASGENNDSVLLAVMERAYILKQEGMQERRIKACFSGTLGPLSRHCKFVANQNKSP